MASKVVADRDYRAVLAREFGRRSAKNPRYSLRAFARDLGMAPSSLSETLHGRHELSQVKARGIAERLGMSEREQETFVELTAMQSGRSAVRRKLAQRRVDALLGSDGEVVLDEEVFASIADWRHFAVIEALKLSTPFDVAIVAARFGAPHAEVETILARLTRLRLIRKTRHGYVVAVPRTRTKDDVPSAAVRGFHRGLLAKVALEIDKQDLQTRELQAVVTGLDEDGMRIIKEKLREVALLARNLGAALAVKDRVYGISMQMVRLIVVLFAFAGPFANGQGGVGNGGKGFVCEEDPWDFGMAHGEVVVTDELYGFIGWGLTSSLRAMEGPWTERLARALARVPEGDRARRERYLRDLAAFSTKVRFVADADLERTFDDLVGTPLQLELIMARCRDVQLANSWTFSRPRFEALPEAAKAALVLHELVYAEYLERASARDEFEDVYFLTSLLLSTQLDSMSPEQYSGLLRSMGW